MLEIISHHFLAPPYRARQCLNPVMPGLPAMSTFRTAQTSGEVKRGYVRTATAVATKSVPQQSFVDQQQEEDYMDVDESYGLDLSETGARVTPTSPPDLGSPMIMSTAAPSPAPSSAGSHHSGTTPAKSENNSTPGKIGNWIILTK